MESIVAEFSTILQGQSDQLADLEGKYASLDQRVGQIATLTKRLQVLQSDFEEGEVDRWTADGYLRPERFAGLQGDVTSVAGSYEATEVNMDRWEITLPFSTATRSMTADATSTVLNATSEEGRLVHVAVFCSTAQSASESANLFLDITIDGGTKQTQQIITDAGSAYTTGVAGFINFGRTGVGPTQLHEGVVIPMNLAYATTCLVEVRTTSASGSSGWVMSGTAYRAVKTN